MTDQGRLAEIKALAEEIRQRNRLVAEDDPRKVLGDHLDWLVGEVELARELGDLLPQKINEIERLRGLLRQLEWAGCFGCETSDERDRWPACPACGAENPPYGAIYDRTPHHRPDCWLAAELA